MSEDEKDIENPYEIVNVVEKILDFNNQNQEGQVLKYLHKIKCLVDYQCL